MKHVCNCRACDSKPELMVEQSGIQDWHHYQCECGVRSAAGSEDEARGAWNAENADAQNMRQLTDTMQELAAAIYALPTNLNGGCCPPGQYCPQCDDA